MSTRSSEWVDPLPAELGLLGVRVAVEFGSGDLATVNFVGAVCETQCP